MQMIGRGGVSTILRWQQQKVLFAFYLLNEVFFSFNSPSGEDRRLSRSHLLDVKAAFHTSLLNLDG